ncbi:hypothetical protein HK104_008265, partial [Borealophlyctis nickersoniae]
MPGTTLRPDAQQQQQQQQQQQRASDFSFTSSKPQLQHHHASRRSSLVAPPHVSTASLAHRPSVATGVSHKSLPPLPLPGATTPATTGPIGPNDVLDVLLECCVGATAVGKTASEDGKLGRALNELK